MGSIQSSFNRYAIENAKCTHSNDHEAIVRLSKTNVLLFRELKNVKTQFGREISSLKEQIAEIHSKFGGVSTNMDGQELETIHFKNSLLETKNQTLIEDIGRLDDELLEANERFGLLPSLNSLLENQVNELKQEVQQLNSSLEASENKFTEEYSKFVDQCYKNDELAEENRVLNERLKTAESELVEHAQQNDELLKQNQALNERLKIAESELIEHAQKNHELAEKNHNLSERLKAAEAQKKIEVPKKPEKVAVSKKQTSKALEKRADEAFDLEKYKEAISLYTEAINVAKSEKKGSSYIALLWSDISDCYHNLGRYDDEVNANQKAIQLDASVPLYYRNRAKTYIKMNMKQETIERWINKALQLDPNDKEAKEMLAKLAKK